MNISLPPIEIVSLRNEVDRFGFSYVLSKKFGLNKTPRSFACFMHGWIWRRDLKVEDMGYFFTPKNTPIIVSTTYQKRILYQNGFTNVYAGGLPFAYINRSNSKRRYGSLLVMPPHSIGAFYSDSISDVLIQFIKSIESEFSEVCFCLHADDANDKNIISLLKNNNIKYITGAHHTDANSLDRMRAIFDYYDYVTTTIMGSHVLYAAFCGCKVSLLRNHYYYITKHGYYNESITKMIPGYISRIIEFANDQQRLSEEFPLLCVDHPKKAIQMTEWANKEIGIDNLMDKKNLMEVLGWTIKSKIKALIRIAISRIGIYLNA